MRKRTIVATALLLSATYSTACALTADQVSRIEGHFATAIAEQRVNLTCSSTMDPRMPEMLQSNWIDTADEVLVNLAAAGFPDAALNSLTAQTRVEAVMMSGDTPFSEVITLCQENSDWQKNLQMFIFFDLGKKVEDVLDE